MSSTADYHKLYDKKPAGIPGFLTEEDKLMVHKNEIFCRFIGANGNMCVNSNRFDTTNALRLHIKLKHGENLCVALNKGPANQEQMEAADNDYANCLAKIREYDKRVKIMSNRETIVRTKAEIADRAVIGTPKKALRTPKKRTSDAEAAVDEATLSKKARIVLKISKPSTTSTASSPALEKQEIEGKYKNKGKPNKAAMRRYGNFKGICSGCKSQNRKASQCPYVEAEDWERDVCEVLKNFIQPEEEDEEDEEDED